MARQSEVSTEILLTILILLIANGEIFYASARYLSSPSSASVIIRRYDSLLSLVPELPIGSNSNNAQIKKGIIDELLQTKITTKKGDFGDVCDSSSFVPVDSLSTMQLSNAGNANAPEGIPTNMWLCIAPIKTDGHFYIHLGHPSKIEYPQLSHKRHSRSLQNDTNDSTSHSVSANDLMSTNLRNGSGGSGFSYSNSDERGSSVDGSESRTDVERGDDAYRTSERIKKKDDDDGKVVLSDVKPSAIRTKESFGDSINELFDIMVMDSESASSSNPSESNNAISNKSESKNGMINIGAVTEDEESVKIYGVRVREHTKAISYYDGMIYLQADKSANIILFGHGLTSDVEVQFTAKADESGGRCDISTSELFKITEAYGHWASVTVKLPEMQENQEFWYFCIRETTSSEAIHQGTAKWLTISTYSPFLPLWFQIIILIVLLILSGLFSGLNLGLMALDKTELKVISNTGTPKERLYAKAIEPIRKHGNFLLCTLLLGNVLVNSTLTILLDNLSSGLIAVIGSTCGIVIFGEIIPQAICSRHGLAVGARTVWLVRIFMLLTGVAAWPISKILDFALGEELGYTYNRERLKELIRVQDSNDIRVEEQNIIYGALELHKKTVAEVMTKLEDIFMLSIDINLDFNTINDIMQQGFSRIPIYENSRTNIVSVLFIKDLAFIDPDDNTPLRTVSQFYQNVCNFVFEDTTLDVIFKEFKEGNKGHMAFVNHINSGEECDPFYEVVGLVTLEDVIEELIQEEIVDETDVFTDNKMKRRRKQSGRGRRDFKEFFQAGNSYRRVQISPQLQVAAFQFLRTSVEPFKESQLSEGILKRMLNQDIIHVTKLPIKDDNSQESFLFVQGRAVDYFILLLEGRVEVTIGKENLTFETGPFTFFGCASLQNVPLGEFPSISSTHMSRNSIVSSIQSLESAKTTFIPDYSVKATTEAIYLKIRRAHYIAARRAFKLEQSQKDPHAEDNFAKEMEKILRAENTNSTVWEVDPESASEKVSSAKDALLHGGTVRSKSDDVELSILNGTNSRRQSLRDSSKQNPKGDSVSTPRDSLTNTRGDSLSSPRHSLTNPRGDSLSTPRDSLSTPRDSLQNPQTSDVLEIKSSSENDESNST